jgi:hypothetical protein
MVKQIEQIAKYVKIHFDNYKEKLQPLNWQEVINQNF